MRWGHPQVFLPRHVTFAALYDSLRDKSKVLVGKRLKEIITTSSGVQAVIGDGSTIQGSILVGADGIHSTVRREMWRLGHEQSPGYFIQDEESRKYQDNADRN
jgi:2-polyprenyl-6-methoxyphenol hydroxylase-like FAD-dependent oxidoreductase